MHGLAGATVKKLGLGSVETWHGGPALRGSCCEGVNINENLEQDVFNSESAAELRPSSQSASCTERRYRSPSPGTTVHVQGKIQSKLRGPLSQLVTTCVLSSFTAGRHPSEKDAGPRTFSRPVVSLACLGGESP